MSWMQAAMLAAQMMPQILGKGGGQTGGQSGGQINPTTYGITQGLGVGLPLLGGMIDTPEKKYGRWAMGMRKDVGDLIRWHLLGDKSPVISGPQMMQMANFNRQAMQPIYQDILHAAARYAGLSSGQTSRMYAQQRLPLEMGFLGRLQEKNIDLGQQRQQMYWDALLRTMGAR